MRNRFMAAGLCLLATTVLVHAQVKVDLLLEQRQYLINESLEVGVRVVNHSGQTLNISGTNWLSFIIEDNEGIFVRQIGEPPPPEPFTVESSYMATQWLDIQRAFEFRENASYTLRARVRLQQWSEDVYSQPVKFEVIRGTKLWEQRFGVPTQSPTAQPEVRKYILQQANYLDELQLYIRVTDESELKVYKVLRLAPMVQISRPEAQLDTLMQLHVLTQVGRNRFLHLVIDPDCKLVLRNTYLATNQQRPQLRISPTVGSVYVAGGVRELRRDDIPSADIFSRPLPERISPLTDDEEKKETEAVSPAASTPPPVATPGER